MKMMLLEKAIVPRLPSSNLPGLHPSAFIFLYVSRILCLNSHLLLPTAGQEAKRGSKDGLGGTVVSSPPVWGSSQCLLPGCHSCPQLAGDAGTRHSGQLQEVTGDPGEPFPAAEQPSCTDTRMICTGVAVEMHTDMIFLCKPVLWLVDLKEQD